MDRDLLKITFRNTLGATAYIFLVSQVMSHGDKLFGQQDSSLTPFAVLLLFSLSAAVVGGLILGQSIFLFFDNKKAQSIKAAIYSVAWLGIFTALALLLLAVAK
jgi:hypothetical protein